MNKSDCRYQPNNTQETSYDDNGRLSNINYHEYFRPKKYSETRPKVFSHMENYPHESGGRLKTSSIMMMSKKKKSIDLHHPQQNYEQISGTGGIKTETAATTSAVAAADIFMNSKISQQQQQQSKTKKKKQSNNNNNNNDIPFVLSSESSNKKKTKIKTTPLKNTSTTIKNNLNGTIVGGGGGVTTSNNHNHNNNNNGNKKHSVSVFQFNDNVSNHNQYEPYYDHHCLEHHHQHQQQHNGYKKSNNKKELSTNAPQHTRSVNIVTTSASASKNSTNNNKKPNSATKKTKKITDSQIQEKINSFKIISKCLKIYMKEEITDHNNSVDTKQIIKLIGAFNKSEISHLSRPLEKLISEIIQLIQECCRNEQNENEIKDSNNQNNNNHHNHNNNHKINEFSKTSSLCSSFMKGKRPIIETPVGDNFEESKLFVVDYSTPPHNNYRHNRNEEESEVKGNNHINNKAKKRRVKEFTVQDFDQADEGEATFNPRDIAKTRKATTEPAALELFPRGGEEEQEELNIETMAHSEYLAKNIISNEIIGMEKNLIELQYESNRLRELIHRSSSYSKNNSSQSLLQKQCREDEIAQLKDILYSQEKIMERIQYMSMEEGSQTIKE